LVGAILVGGLAYAGEDRSGARTSAVGGNDLFVRTADGGALQRVAGRKRTFRLTLKGLGGPVTVFTDRPQRKAGSESTAQFVRRWRSRGFSASPPNAALVLARGSRRQDVKVFEISNPRLRKGVLSFTARDLGRKSTKALAGFGKRADKALPRRFTRASLFIDPSDAGTEQQVEFRFTYTGSGADNSLASVSDSTLTDSQILSTGGNVRAYVSPKPSAGIIMGCERRSDDPCTITATLTVSPAHSPVKVGVDLKPHTTLTGRVLPNGASVPLTYTGTFTLNP
jgi:hypothetical protein